MKMIVFRGALQSSLEGSFEIRLWRRDAEYFDNRRKRMTYRSKGIIFGIIVLFLSPSSFCVDKGFSIDNLTILPYERFTLKGADPDKKEVIVTIEYNLKDDAQTGKKMWMINSSQVLQGTKTDLTAVMRLADLDAVSFKRIRTYEEGSYTETFELGNQPVENKDPKQFFCANTEMLLYVLRAFPFASDTKEITVKTFGSKNGGFNLSVKNNGLRKIAMKSGDNPDAYELEVSVNIPVWSAFIPKSYY
jgi:hypothetical protein